MPKSPVPDVVDRRALVGTAADFVAAALAAACSGGSTAPSSAPPGGTITFSV